MADMASSSGHDSIYILLIKKEEGSGVKKPTSFRFQHEAERGPGRASHPLPDRWLHARRGMRNLVVSVRFKVDELDRKLNATGQQKSKPQ